MNNSRAGKTVTYSLLVGVDVRLELLDLGDLLLVNALEGLVGGAVVLRERRQVSGMLK